MTERRAREERRRAREFEAFVAGAGGRLLHAATLLTGEPPERAPAARELLEGALARTYADWGRLRGEDPYEHTRHDLVVHFAHTAWRYRRARGGLLGGLPPQERLILVLRICEGVAEEQAAAALGLPVERVRDLCTKGTAAALSGSARRAGGDGTGGGQRASGAVRGGSHRGGPAAAVAGAAAVPGAAAVAAGGASAAVASGADAGRGEEGTA